MYDIHVNHRYTQHTGECTHDVQVNHRYIQHTGESQVRMKYRWITGAHNIHANHKYTQHTG